MRSCKVSQQEINFAQTIIRIVLHNESALKKANANQKCGCACCGHIFSPNEISDYENDAAICPYCGIKSIVPEGKSIPINSSYMKECSRNLYDILKNVGTTEVLFPQDSLRRIDEKITRIKRCWKETDQHET